MKERGIRKNKNGTFEGYGTVHNKRGDALKYSFTRATQNEVMDIKAKIRLLGIVENNVVKIRINKYTDEIELIKNGRNRNDNTKLNKDILVKDYLIYYLFEHRKNGVSGRKVTDNTFASYFDLGKYIERYLGDKRVVDVTLEDLRDFICTLQNEGKAETTVKKVRDILTSLINYANKDKITEENVLQGERLTIKESKGAKEKKIMDKESVRVFLKYCNEHKYCDLILAQLTGCRASELARNLLERYRF